MKTIICIRHGTTAGNLEKRYIGGGTDEPLCAEGIVTIKALVAIGLYPPVTRVMASPMKRCAETAKLVYPAHVPAFAEDFREMHFGAFEGRTFDEIIRLPGQSEFGMDEAHMIFPEGEAEVDFTARCVDAFEAVLRGAVAETLALVVHGGVIMAMMRHLFGGSLYDYQVKNGRGFCLTEDGGAWQYRKLGE